MTKEEILTEAKRVTTEKVMVAEYVAKSHVLLKSVIAFLEAAPETSRFEREQRAMGLSDNAC